MFLMHSRMLVSELGLQQDTPPARGFATYPARINNSSVKCAQTSVACAQGGHACTEDQQSQGRGWFRERTRESTDQRLSECWQADSPSAISYTIRQNPSTTPFPHTTPTASRTP